MALAEAVRESKIVDAPVESLKQVLRLIMVKVGLRSQNWPNEAEKAVLLSHIVSNYGGHTHKEIVLAFDMAIAGKLEMGDNESVQCYENFSCLYFSSIMNAYRRWSAQAIKHAVKETPPMIEHKEDTSDNAMKEWFEQTARDVQSGKLNLEFVPPMLYDWMAKTKQIPDCKDFYKAAALKIGQRLAKDMTPDGIKEANNYRQMWKAGEFTGKYVKEIENLAKSIVIWNHILKGGK